MKELNFFKTCPIRKKKSILNKKNCLGFNTSFTIMLKKTEWDTETENWIVHILFFVAYIKYY